jgi:hypothetical protein
VARQGTTPLKQLSTLPEESSISITNNMTDPESDFRLLLCKGAFHVRDRQSFQTGHCGSDNPRMVKKLEPAEEIRFL